MTPHPTHQLFAELNTAIPADAYPPGVVPVRQQIQNTSFFPGGTGLWCEASTGALPEMPVGGVMILGHDFHNVAGYERSLQLQRENLKTATWKHLLEFLAQVPLGRERCFFTNIYMGLREGEKTTGQFTGSRYPAFVERCRQFFLAQIALQRPSVILALGRFVPPFLAPLSTDLAPWAVTGSTRALDAAKTSLIDGVKFKPHGEVCVVVSLVHPSFRLRNVVEREWNGFTGGDAEVEMVREALRAAKGRSAAA